MWPALGLPEPVLTDVADDVFLSIGDEPADYVVLRDQGLFDENYYALHSGDVLSTGADMLRHYCEFGWRENRQPNFYFDSPLVRGHQPRGRVNLVSIRWRIIYLWESWRGGGRSCFSIRSGIENTYGVPDEMSALAHFLAHRREGKVSPNEYFDPACYAARKGRDRSGPGRDPFARFLVAGLTENVSPSANFDLADWRRRVDGPGVAEFPAFAGPGEGQSAGALPAVDVSMNSSCPGVDPGHDADDISFYSPAFARRAARRSISACTAAADWPTNWS